MFLLPPAWGRGVDGFGVGGLGMGSLTVGAAGVLRQRVVVSGPGGAADTVAYVV